MRANGRGGGGCYENHSGMKVIHVYALRLWSLHFVSERVLKKVTVTNRLKPKCSPSNPLFKVVFILLHYYLRDKNFRVITTVIFRVILTRSDERKKGKGGGGGFF